MRTKLDRSSYRFLIDGDIEYLKEQPKTMERDHIEEVLRASVDLLYPVANPADGENECRCTTLNWLLKDGFCLTCGGYRR